MPLPKSHQRVPFRAGEVDVVERAVGGGADPEVPVEVVGDGVFFGGAPGGVDDIAALARWFPAPGAADPDVDVGDGADGAGLDEFDDAAVVVAGVDLGAHLGGDAGFGGGFGDDACLVDIAGEGFFAVDVFFAFEGGEGGEGVGVFGGGDDDGVEVEVVVGVEFAEVAVGFGVGVFCGGAFEVVAVDVAEGDDVFGFGHLAEVAAAAAADADGGDVEFRVGGLRRGDRREAEDGGGGGGGGEEAAAVHAPRWRKAAVEGRRNVGVMILFGWWLAKWVPEWSGGVNGFSFRSETTWW